MNQMGLPMQPQMGPVMQQPINQQPQFRQIDPVMEEKAANAKLLGKISVILSFGLMCCCAYIGPAVGIFGLMTASKTKGREMMMSPYAAENLRKARMFCTVGIVVGVAGIVLTGLFSRSSYMQEYTEALRQALEQAAQQSSAAGTV